MSKPPAVWFPTVRTGTGTDVFTERLVSSLRCRGLRAAITWLPLRAEFAPWTVAVPKPPRWATVCHVNTWLHPRFIPDCLPVVATLHHAVHDPAHRAYKGRARSAYHRWWVAPTERRVLRHADYTVAVSKFVADVARGTLWHTPLEVIYNGIDTEYFSPVQRSTRIGGRPFKLLFVGSWIRRKGIGLLAPIMECLGGDFELDYTGSGRPRGSSAHMPPNMRDVGHLTEREIVAAMQASDALLFPSYSEGFGLVAAEAMSCGLPVIAADTAAIRELVTHGESGVICKAGDVQAFARSVRALAEQDTWRAMISHNARVRAAKCFGIERMTDAYIRIYCRVHLYSSGVRV